MEKRSNVTLTADDKALIEKLKAELSKTIGFKLTSIDVIRHCLSQQAKLINAK